MTPGAAVRRSFEQHKKTGFRGISLLGLSGNQTRAISFKALASCRNVFLWPATTNQPAQAATNLRQERRLKTTRLTHVSRDHASRAVLGQLHPSPVEHLPGVPHASSGHGDELLRRFFRLGPVTLSLQRSRSACRVWKRRCGRLGTFLGRSRRFRRWLAFGRFVRPSPSRRSLRGNALPLLFVADAGPVNCEGPQREASVCDKCCRALEFQ